MPRCVRYGLVVLATLAGCGGYDSADPDELEARKGEIVGVLVNDREKASPDAWIQLYQSNGTEAIRSQQGMDSDGRFGIFPPETGTYNIVGCFGEPATSTTKVIKQGIEFIASEGLNIGKLQAQKVAALSFRVTDQAGVGVEDVQVEVLGFAKTTTVQEGVGAIETGVPAGTYDLRFSKDGYQTLSQTDVAVVSEEVKLIEVSLESID